MTAESYLSFWSSVIVKVRYWLNLMAKRFIGLYFQPIQSFLITEISGLNTPMLSLPDQKRLQLLEAKRWQAAKVTLLTLCLGLAGLPFVQPGLGHLSVLIVLVVQLVRIILNLQEISEWRRLKNQLIEPIFQK